jgi:hypothetical protein
MKKFASLCLSLAMLMSLLCVQASAASSVELIDGYGNTLVISDVIDQQVDHIYTSTLNVYTVAVGTTLSLSVKGDLYPNLLAGNECPDHGTTG